MAAAIQKLWPDAKFGVGPAVENGFYYDIDLGEKAISEEDFINIENEMKEIIKGNYTFEHKEVPIDEAIQWAREANQPYKIELLNDLKRTGTTVAKEIDSQASDKPSDKAPTSMATLYTLNNFTDLCRGPHIETSAKAGEFKLMRIAGAYWRGKETNPQMQRLYGVAFAGKEELTKYIEILEEAKKRDHRKLGQELDLFVFSDLVGPGLPLFTPRGTAIRQELGKFSQELQASYGYECVTVPHITKVDLYKKSGHYDKYPERFMVSSVESDSEFMMKPMNCPHHAQIYASKPRSYRDLPIRYMENTMVYRDEKAGELHGLIRVRSATQDDGHVFCRMDQIEQEFTSIMNMIKDMYSVFNMSFHARLSFRDESDNYLGDVKQWNDAQKVIEDVAKKLDLEYFVGVGEAAFYGPKIDILVTDALGREWQCATEQLDFVQPERFNLKYTDSDGQEKQPVMIHKALLGSIERFMAIYIEHTYGKLPVWLSPEQIRFLTVNQTDEIVNCANDWAQKAKDLGLRAGVDASNESVGKKIRESESKRIPYTIVIGGKEVKSEETIPRVRKDLIVQISSSIKLANFIKTVANEAKTRSSHSTM
jgi:threonyl-tRNA synthetase